MWIMWPNMQFDVTTRGSATNSGRKAVADGNPWSTVLNGDMRNLLGGSTLEDPAGYDARDLGSGKTLKDAWVRDFGPAPGTP
jgi:hypothetical protein